MTFSSALSIFFFLQKKGSLPVYGFVHFGACSPIKVEKEPGSVCFHTVGRFPYVYLLCHIYLFPSVERNVPIPLLSSIFKEEKCSILPTLKFKSLPLKSGCYALLASHHHPLLLQLHLTCFLKDNFMFPSVFFVLEWFQGLFSREIDT